MHFKNEGVGGRPLKKKQTDTLTMTSFGIAKKSTPDKSGAMSKRAVEIAKNAARNETSVTSASIIAAYTGKKHIDVDAKNFETARWNRNESI